MPSRFLRLARWLVTAVLATACNVQPLADPDQNLDPGATPTGVDDVGDPDMDDDGVPNAEDDCPASPDPGQKDSDGDGIGDACDDCPQVSDSEQADTDENGTGDACESSPTTPPTPPTDEFCPPEEDDDLC